MLKIVYYRARVSDWNRLMRRSYSIELALYLFEPNDLTSRSLVYIPHFSLYSTSFSTRSIHATHIWCLHQCSHCLSIKISTMILTSFARCSSKNFDAKKLEFWLWEKDLDISKSCRNTSFVILKIFDDIDIDLWELTLVEEESLSLIEKVRWLVTCSKLRIACRKASLFVDHSTSHKREVSIDWLRARFLEIDSTNDDRYVDLTMKAIEFLIWLRIKSS